MKNKKKKGQTCTLTRRERKVERRKKNDYRRQTTRPPLTRSISRGRACDNTCNDMTEVHFLTIDDVTHAFERAQTLPTHLHVKNTHQQDLILKINVKLLNQKPHNPGNNK